MVDGARLNREIDRWVVDDDVLAGLVGVRQLRGGPDGQQ